MSPEISARLCCAFPRLYRDHTQPIAHSLMAFGFECGDGWADLLHRLSEALVSHAERAGLDIVAVQVKEKYGSLRVYVYGGDDEADRLEAAEVESESICETCGDPGELHSNGWRVTGCEAHRDDACGQGESAIPPGTGKS